MTNITLSTAHHAETSMQSPFQEHLNTNYVPTDAEIEHIRAHLVPHEAELARLESLIHELSIQRDLVKIHIESHRALISHPRRLPQDIVEEIFLDCLPTDRNPVMSAVEAPLLLGRLCSAWRAIAFAMPRLWNSLHIPLGFVSQSESKEAAMVDWLERSAPLGLTLSVTGLMPWLEIPGSPDIFQSLLASSTWWSALHVSKVRPEDFTQKLAHVHAPLLQEIQLAFALGLDTGEDILSSNLIRTMKTTRVIISAEGLDAFVPELPFTWGHLTHLTLKHSASWTHRGISSETAYRLLTGCKNLNSVDFPLAPPFDPQDRWSNESLVLPYLESLVIHTPTYGSDDLMNLVDHLIMPQLRQFHLPNSALKSAPGFLEHLGSRSPALSDLQLGLSGFPRVPFSETLQAFPSLTELRLWYWSQPEPDHTESRDQDAIEFLAALDPDSDAPNPFPVLKELNMMLTGWLGDEIWTSFLEKQLEYKTNLQRVNFSVWADPPAVPADVKPFSARGLQVSITYHAYLVY